MQTVYYLEEGLANNPRDVKLRLLLATALQRPPANDTSRAMRLLREAVDLKPTDDQAYVHLGYAYLRRGSNHQAVVEFKKAFRLSTDKGVRLSALLGLVSASRKSGNEVNAKRYMAALRKHYPGIDTELIQIEVEASGPQLENTGGMEAETSRTHPTFDKRLRAVARRIEQTSNNTGIDCD